MKLILLIFILVNTIFANSFKDIKTLEAVFVQTIINSSNKKIKYRGKIDIKAPYFVVWSYEDPLKQVFIIKDEVTIVEPELEQAIYTKLDKEVNILQLLQNAKYISKDKYQATLYDIDYTILLKDNILKSILYKDQMENNIQINFYHVKQNLQLDDMIFEPNIPEDFDIIRK